MKPSVPAADALLALLAPVWQAAIGAATLVFVAVATVRLARRGRSRMRTALLVIGAALVGLTALSLLASR